MARPAHDAGVHRAGHGAAPAAGWLYSAALYALVPALLLRLLVRGLARDRRYLARIPERFGRLPVLPEAPRLWVHAVSVGEAHVAAPLVAELARRHPGHRLVVSTSSAAGAATLDRLLRADAVRVWLPFDLPGATARFVRRLAPEAGVLIETEIWPNLCRAAHRAGVPVVLANGRVSARSARGRARVGALVGRALADLAAVAARDRASARRFRVLGGGSVPVTVTGDMRFDRAPTPQDRAAGDALHERLGGNRPVWIAGSTHAGEEEVVLAAHTALRSQVPGTALLLVPRHPRRAGEIAGRCRAQGFVPASRAAGDRVGDTTTVVLGDVLGELPWLYAAADVAFVGGSLVAVGGHNPVEPAMLGLPVLAGPHRDQFEAAYRALRSAGGVIDVDGADDLAAAVADLLRDPERRDRAGAAARGVAESGRGAVARNADLVDALRVTAIGERGAAAR